jgi:hypothetical protein
MKVKLSDPQQLENVSSSLMSILRLRPSPLPQATQVRNPELQLSSLSIGADNLVVNCILSGQYQLVSPAYSLPRYYLAVLQINKRHLHRTLQRLYVSRKLARSPKNNLWLKSREYMQALSWWKVNASK